MHLVHVAGVAHEEHGGHAISVGRSDESDSRELGRVRRINADALTLVGFEIGRRHSPRTYRSGRQGFA